MKPLNSSRTIGRANCHVRCMVFGAGVLCLSAAFTRAQNAMPAAPSVSPILPGAPRIQGAEVDRVVVIVNGDLILDSDVDQELRFDSLKVSGDTLGELVDLNPEQARNRAIERLINRDLILQQIQSQQEFDSAESDITSEIEGLRKTIPSCVSKYHCETKGGWDSYLASGGFSEVEFRDEWRERMKVIAFTEQRFRMGIRITTPQIKDYYEKTLLPHYAELHATPPSLDRISDRIQALLLQQEVTSLLNDWLKSLRAQGNVVIMHPGEATP